MRDAVASNQYRIAREGCFRASNLQVIRELVHRYPFGCPMNEFPIQIIAVLSLHDDQIATPSREHPLGDD